MASFHLHQSAENFLRTIPITFILYGHKSHDLSELMNAAKKHTPEIFKAFPRDTPEEKRLFDLLQRAYIESRYNPDFEITKADIDALLPKIELLRDVVEQVCNERLAYYDSRIEKQTNSAGIRKHLPIPTITRPFLSTRPDETPSPALSFSPTENTI